MVNFYHIGDRIIAWGIYVLYANAFFIAWCMRAYVCSYICIYTYYNNIILLNILHR